MKLVFCVLSVFLFCLVGCGHNPFAAERPLVVNALFDLSDLSGISETSAVAGLEAQLPDVIHRRGEIRFYRLDDIRGVVFAGRFVVGNPARESPAVVAAFERDRVAEGKRTFLLLRESLFSTRPHSSRLALALSIMSTDAPPNAEVRYAIYTDGREWGNGIDMECAPPTREVWQSYLRRNGMLRPASLRGATVTFYGFQPLMPVGGNRCPASLVRQQQVRDLWEVSIRSAGGTVTFQADTSPSVLAALIMLTSSLILYRKLRVKYRAWRDRAKGRGYAPLAIILELLGQRPGLDATDPRHDQALTRLSKLLLDKEDTQTAIDEVRCILTDFVWWVYPTLGLSGCSVLEGVAGVRRQLELPADDN